MVVMVSNNAGFDAGVLHGRYPGKIGHLQNPADFKTPKSNIFWAVDNGVFGAYQSNSTWSEEPFYRYLEKYHHYKPSWAVVPDSVGDKHQTLKKWREHYRTVKSYVDGLAFAVQDGMSPQDVPSEADVIFVGGTTSWKWRNLQMWTENFPRVHVGRVNTYKLLWEAHTLGAESCDGTGWFRGGPERLKGLEVYLNESTNGGRRQEMLL